MNQKKAIEIVCFGEVLWDNLPSGRMPGGAPMNVAYHLSKLGIKSTLISQVGDDQDGLALIYELARLGIDVQHCKIDRLHQTSTVNVHFTDEHEAKYDIVFPAAWDFIEYHLSHSALAARSDAFVFGSLSSRSEVTRDTLLKLVAQAKYRVFDVNLRAPHYQMNTLTQLLNMANLLKLNVHELTLITDCYQQRSLTEEQRVKFLQSKFDIDEILLTKGMEGSAFFQKDHNYTQTAYPVDVVDTVGSGDSFLAAFLARKLSGSTPAESLDFASALAGFITSKNGACPDYEIAELENFRAASFK